MARKIGTKYENGKWGAVSFLFQIENALTKMWEQEKKERDKGPFNERES